MKEVAATRNLETVTAEIVTITGQAKCAVVSAAIEIGRRLVEAKELVPHGEWGKYLEEKVSFSPSQAGNMMRLYNEYGSNQESLFGGGAKAIEALSVTSAIRLLSLPAEEREAFVEENDVAAMSTRELEKAIKERNEALEAQKAAEASARQSEDAVKTAEAAVAGYQERLAALEKKLDSAKTGEKKAKEALKQLKDNPVLPEDLMAKIRKEAEVTAAEAAAGKAEEKLKKLEDARARAEKRAAEAAQALEEAQKQRALGSPEAAVFRVLFGKVQEDFQQMGNVLSQVQLQDPELAEKLRAAVRKLLENLEGKVNG